jgi:hypothetical protein
VISDWIGKDVEGSGHGLILRYCLGICLEGLRKTTKNLGQDNWSVGSVCERSFGDPMNLDRRRWNAPSKLHYHVPERSFLITSFSQPCACYWVVSTLHLCYANYVLRVPLETYCLFCIRFPVTANTHSLRRCQLHCLPEYLKTYSFWCRSSLKAEVVHTFTLVKCLWSNAGIRARIVILCIYYLTCYFLYVILSLFTRDG